MRGRIGETKDFAFYMNEFLKELPNLKALWIVKTNLGGLMHGCKNVNMFRELRSTKLAYVNLTCCDLKNAYVERIVTALRALTSIKKLVVADLVQLGNLFRLRRIKADASISFP